MKKVVVIMSTYNGEQYVEKQILSILSQKNVDVQLYIRDDGSKDGTVKVIKTLQESYPEKISYVRGENCGWEHSFMLGLRDAPHADYYAFADQDDVWMEEKLYQGVEMMEQEDDGLPLMYHCNKWSVSEDMKPFAHQVRRTPQPLNRQNAMIQEYAQGCSIILNNAARELVCKHIPTQKLAHDFWCGLVCYLFGKVIYDDRKWFYHISHGANASGEGHMLSSWKGRLKALASSSSVYYSPYKDLQEGYGDLLKDTDKRFIQRVLNYKTSPLDKCRLLCSRQFVRDSVVGTLSLKVAILLNKL